jgi:predicted membrane protein
MAERRRSRRRHYSCRGVLFSISTSFFFDILVLIIFFFFNFYYFFFYVFFNNVEIDYSREEAFERELRLLKHSFQFIIIIPSLLDVA